MSENKEIDWAKLVEDLRAVPIEELMYSPPKHLCEHHGVHKEWVTWSHFDKDILDGTYCVLCIERFLDEVLGAKAIND